MRAGSEDHRTVLHWYDFMCPFCYVGQHRNAILIQHGLMWLSWHSRPTPTFRPEGLRRGLALGRCMRCWSAKPKKLDCRFTGLHAFLTRGEPWPQLSGPDGINQPVSRNSTENSLKRT
jgi:hypothetical protein